MEFLSSLFYFIIAIGILVFIHEFGHFIAARLSGIRTDIFAFGMGYRLLGWNKITGFSFGKLPPDWDGNGHCDYRICAFPIGGYVKVAGMVDESMDTNSLKSEPKEWEFRSKGFMKKFFVLVAGVCMNFLLAIFIYFGINLIEGKTILKTTTVGYVDNKSLASKIGMQKDDKIISVGNYKVNSWDDILEKLALKNLGDSRYIVVKRNGENVTLYADGKILLKTLTGSLPLGLNPEKTFVVVSKADASMTAGKIGMMSGDTITKLNNEEINSFTELTNILHSNKNRDVLVEWKRADKILSATGKIDNSGKLGFAPKIISKAPQEKMEYGLLEAFGQAVTRTIDYSQVFVNSVKQIFAGNISAKESLGGPIMIAKGARDYAALGLNSFLVFIAMLSITLAIINILPLPALDGGHIVFVIIEAIIRKELPLKFKIAVQNVGMALLLVLMAFVFYNDISKLF